MNYQKPVKVKSRWTQSCQMEMMMDESQSSLDMSDTITDVSTSDLNESTDCSSELNSMKLRRSRRIGSNRTDYRQLNGLKIIRKKKASTFKLVNKKNRKKKQLLIITNTDKEDQCKDNILKECNIIKSLSTDWDNITIYQSERKSKSVNDLSEVIENLPSKPIRRASLTWGFTFTSTEKVEDSSLLKMSSYDNISNAIKCINLNETLFEETSSSIDNSQLDIDKKLIYKEKIINENTFQKSNSSVIDAISCRDSNLITNSVLKTNKFNKTSTNSFELNQKNDELNPQSDKCNKEKTHISNLVTLKFSLSENFKFNSNYKSRKIRSKSVDYFTKNTNNTIRRCQSHNDINKLERPVDFALNLQKSHKKIIPKKRRQSKRIKPKNNRIHILDDIKAPEVDYNQVADEIYKEHKNQLHNARINDEEFDKKLKSTNFTLVNENVYRPNK